MDNIPKYISQKQQEEFERMLLGQMNLEEETMLNKQLELDPVLKKQFEEFKLLFFAVQEEGLRTQLDKFHKNVEEKTVVQKPYFNFYRIAAGIAVLLALGLWFVNQQNPTERLYEKFFTPDPGLPTVMGTNDNYAFYEAMVDYKQDNYAEAIRKWEKLLSAQPENDTLNYFLGVSHLANKNVDEAIGYLNSLTNKKSSAFYDDINAYLGLALLKQGKIEEAKSALAKSSSPKSKSILSQLN